MADRENCGHCRGKRVWQSVFPGKFPPVLSTSSHTAKYLLTVLLAIVMDIQQYSEIT